MFNMIQIKKGEWKQAKIFLYHKKNQHKIKFKKRKQATHSFIYVGGEIFAIEKKGFATHLLGEGHFGKVRLVQSENGDNFAVKIEASNLKSENSTEIEVMKKINYFIGQAVQKFKFNKIFKARVTKHKLYTVIMLRIGVEFHKEIYVDKTERYRKPLTYKKKLIFALQISKAIQNLHSYNIIHGDVKPANFIVNSNENDGNHTVIEPVDYAFSLILCPSNDTVIFKTRGTPLYVAPEVIRQKTYSFASDIYALGVIFYRDLELQNGIVQSMLSTCPQSRPKLDAIIIYLSLIQLIQIPSKNSTYILNNIFQNLNRDEEGYYIDFALSLINKNTSSPLEIIFYFSTLHYKKVLEWAINNKHLKVLVFLIQEKKILSDKKNKAIKKIFLEAIQSHCIAIFNTFLSIKLDFNIFDRLIGPNNESVLTLVIENAFPEKIVQSIINTSTYCNYPNWFGRTPLMSAISRRFLSDSLIKALIKKTNLQHTDGNKDDALTLAIKNHFSYEIIELLLSNSRYTIEYILDTAIQHGSCENIIKAIAQKITNFNYVNNFQQTLLMRAIISQYSTDILNILIKTHPDINHQDTHGNTILILAISFGASHSTVEGFIEMGSNLFIKNIKGKTAFLIAKEQKKKNIINILTLSMLAIAFAKKWNLSFLEKSYQKENRNIIPRINPLLYLFKDRTILCEKRKKQLTLLSESINKLNSHTVEKSEEILNLYKIIEYIKAQLKKESNYLGTRLHQTLSKIQTHLNEIRIVAYLSDSAILQAQQAGIKQYKHELSLDKTKKKNNSF